METEASASAAAPVETNKPVEEETTQMSVEETTQDTEETVDEANDDKEVEEETDEPKDTTKSKKRKAEQRSEIPGERRSERPRQAPRELYKTVDEAPVEVEFVVPEGPGTKLRDIDYLGEKISKCGKRDAELLKMLYQVMFSRRFSLGVMKEAKQHILDFSGFVTLGNDDEKEKFRDDLAIKLCRGTVGFVDVIMDFLHIDRSKKSFVDAGAQGSKDDKVERIIDWLSSPTATDVKVKSSTKPKKAKKTKAATSKEKKTPASKKKMAAATADDAETDDEENDEKPKKKAPKRKSEAKDGAAKKKTKKTAAPKPADEGETESDNEDFEEMARKAEERLKKKKKLPLPDDIQAKVKQIVTEGDVETLTLKAVMDALTADLKVDVTPHKKAIKDFIANSL
ncbi:Aste57867_2242 [Aphanomyces stellatus]|uniref:Aste57867_2242 protein n=1 Tax=Aphanomyces stellatus TaxID=120398 RepID=A0A485KAW4_9STRA|nr:hypothetical protein As57867_002237 [Aphanomyces stellatus]VFT79445.1 Aste57867_2242 [Aphanomyces stellatus]